MGKKSIQASRNPTPILRIKRIISFCSPWDENEPSKSEEGYCGSMCTDGKLHANECGNSAVSAKFICERPLGAPPLCGDGWEHYGQSCYKVQNNAW